jgi:acyl-CoA thioesterase-1
VKLRSKKLNIGGRVLALFILFIHSASCANTNSAQKGNNASMATPAEQSAPVIYTALGDSTGVGVGAKQGGGYVARLFERIKSERPQSHLTNLCVSGATTDDVLRSQLQPAINSHPTLVTLGIGINDIGHGQTLERFARNYEEIIKRLKTETSARIVVTNIPDISFAPVVPGYARDETRRRVQSFNEKIESVAKQYELLVVDTYSETHEMVPTHPEFFSEDGFHPSDVGYEYWAKTMWPLVKTAIGE